MKRLFDIVGSLILIVLLSPVLLFISLVVLIDDGAPVIFKQERVGLNNQLFKIRKFRTMKTHTRTAATKDLKESSEVITTTGRFLRKTSLDELPQLFNILEGTMSFVGPRPLIPQEEEIRRLRAQRDVYSVRPGVTGWAQVNGRDLITNEDKAKMDREYIDRMSLWFDFKIMLKTIYVVLRREGIAEGGEERPAN